MATIADTLDLTDTTISFSLYTAPVDGAANVTSGRPTFVTTDENGAFSTTLVQGTWTVRMPHTPSFTISVPSGAGTYDFEDLRDDEEAPALVVADQYFATLTDFMASTSIAQLVWITATGDNDDQDGGFFARTGSGTHDGVNIIVRDDGTTYTRIGA